MRNGLLQWIAVLLATTLIVGCGFQLRDQYQLPPSLQQVYLQAPKFSEFANVFEQRLNLAGVELVNADPGLVIAINRDELSRRTLSLSGSGQVAEYELIYSVDYSINEANKDPVDLRIEVYRDYQDDPNFALAKTRERELLVAEMREEAARRMLRQILAQLAE